MWGNIVSAGSNCCRREKITFTYTPKKIDITKYEYGDRYQVILDLIEKFSEVLLVNGVDPDEVYGEIDPKNSPNSPY